MIFHHIPDRIHCQLEHLKPKELWRNGLWLLQRGQATSVLQRFLVWLSLFAQGLVVENSDLMWFDIVYLTYKDWFLVSELVSEASVSPTQVFAGVCRNFGLQKFLISLAKRCKIICRILYFRYFTNIAGFGAVAGCMCETETKTLNDVNFTCETKVSWNAVAARFRMIQIFVTRWSVLRDQKALQASWSQWPEKLETGAGCRNWSFYLDSQRPVANCRGSVLLRAWRHLELAHLQHFRAS